MAIIDIEINACPEQKQRPCIKHINDDWAFLLNIQLTIVLPNSVFVYLKVNYFPLSHLSCFKNLCHSMRGILLHLMFGFLPVVDFPMLVNQALTDSLSFSSLSGYWLGCIICKTLLISPDNRFLSQFRLVSEEFVISLSLRKPLKLFFLFQLTMRAIV